LIEKEVKLLPEGKKSYSNIYIAGFSMGGAGTLATFSKWNKTEPLRGAMALSGWNPILLKDFADNVAVQSQIPMIRYHGEHDWVVNPDKAIADWTADNQHHTHVNNESHLKLIKEKWEGHDVTQGGKNVMRTFFADPESIVNIEKSQISEVPRTMSIKDAITNAVLFYLLKIFG
jgi:predicted esterase